MDSNIEKFIEAIKEREGWYPPNSGYPAGSRSWRNKNPGNCKYVSGMKLAIGKDKGGFAVFKSEEDGTTYLKNMILNAAEGRSRVYKPSDTVLDFFSKYSPGSDGNDSEAYANFVAKKVGITINQTLQELFV